MAEIFDFSDFRTFLRASQRRHPQLKRALTTEEWSKRLGYKSPRSVAMVLKARRFPSSELIESFARDLKLNPIRKRYFELLVMKERYKEEKEDLEKINSELESLNIKVPEKIINERVFFPISEWYYLVIRQLVQASDFEENGEWISKRLGSKLSPEEARKAVHKMLEHKFLMRDENGALQVVSQESLASTPDVPAQAMKRYLAQMMQRGVEALSEHDSSEREFLALTLRFDADRMPEAKQAIRDFEKTFNKGFSSKKSTDVFQLGVQFFKHTKS